MAACERMGSLYLAQASAALTGAAIGAARTGSAMGASGLGLAQLASKAAKFAARMRDMGPSPRLGISPTMILYRGNSKRVSQSQAIHSTRYRGRQ
jgi:hypothetical protein